MTGHNLKPYYEGYGLKIIQTKPGYYDVYDAKCGGRLKSTFKDVPKEYVDNYIQQTTNIRKRNEARRKGRSLWQES